MSALLPRPLRLLTQPVRLPGGIEGLFCFAAGRNASYGDSDRSGSKPAGGEAGTMYPWSALARDYYRIETAAGRCYWVFRRLPAGPWFLHGMFD